MNYAPIFSINNNNIINYKIYFSGGLKLTQEFLEQYKALEQLLRSIFGPEMSVLNYESKLSIPDADKLKVCRIIRNFLQHNPDASSFITPSKEMIAHLKNVASQAALELETAKDKTYKLSPIKTTMTIRQASKIINKTERNWAPVVDEKGFLVGIITMERLFRVLCNGADVDIDTIEKTIKKTELNKSLNSIPIIECTEKLVNFANEKTEVIVLKNGKYCGIVKWN